MKPPFRWPIRVYFEDTDAAGIVYHARYLHFAERGRTEMLRAIGFDHMSLRRDYDVVFAVQRCDMHFRRAAKLDDALEVQSYVLDLRGARIEFEQRIVREEELICRILVTAAVVNGALRPTRVPLPLVSAFADQQME